MPTEDIRFSNPNKDNTIKKQIFIRLLIFIINKIIITYALVDSKIT